MKLRINEELSALIPALQPEEYELLEKSLLSEGCRDSLIIWNDTIIDGHNRYKICTKHNIEFDTQEMEFNELDDVKEWMINNQFSRRNLPLYERARLALKLKPIYEDKAKENHSRAVAESNINRKNPYLQKSGNMEYSSIKTERELAKVAGVSHDTIYKVEKIEEKAPEEVKRQLSSGEISINKAYQEIKKQEKKEKLEEKKQEYKDRVEQASESKHSKKVDIENTDKKFRVIYADPAWSYNDKQNTDKLGGAIKHYDTMSIRELSELPVKNITEDNAVLFLWVTSPLLEESFEVIKAWGFKYKTSFIWDKVKHNMGHYNSVRHEFLLIATKGSCTPDNKKLYDSVQSIERTEHSSKPKEFMDIIDDLYIYGNRLEMFAREQHKDNWLYWGNEI